jgi:hypothetical protein
MLAIVGGLLCCFCWLWRFAVVTTMLACCTFSFWLSNLLKYATGGGDAGVMILLVLAADDELQALGIRIS